MKPIVEDSKALSAERIEEHDGGRTKATALYLNKFSPLHPLYINGIGTVLVVLCISIGILWELARNSGGFEIRGANKYILTYGPTAILICVVAAWRQLDYYTKVITPWVALSHGSAPAHKSVLLDYVSVLQMRAWWEAIGNKHYAVVMTTSGFALLKFAMLASTGLFVLKPSLLKMDLDATLNTILGSPLFNITNNVAVFDQSLFYTAYGILVQNLDKPFGLGTRLAYSTFELPKQVSKNNGNFTIEVDAFVPSFDCRPATVDIIGGSANSSDQHPIVPYQIASPACQFAAGNPSLYALNPRLFRCPEKQFSGMIQNVDCSENVFNTNVGVYKLLLLTDIRYTQTLDKNEENAEISQSITATSWSTEIVDSTALICRLDYTQQKVRVSGSADGQIEPVIPSVTFSPPENHYDNFSPDDLDSLFRGALSASDEILGSRLDQAYSEEYPDPMFKAMSAYVEGSYATLMNTSTMIEAAGEVATQLAAQIAHQYLRVNVTRPSEMAVFTLEAKLEITTLAAWLVFGSLLVVAASCICLALIWRDRWSRTLAHVTPNLILPSANADNILEKTLVASQSCREKQLSDLLESTKIFFSQGSAEIPTISADNEIDFQVLDKSEHRWFAPFTISWPVTVITMVLASALIVVLELLQRLSVAHAGFLKLPLVQDDVTDVMVRVIPALAAVLVASLFNCLEFNVLLLTPYHSMQSPKPLSHLCRPTLISRSPLLGLWSSIRYGHLPAILSTTAALTGSLLAVVVSGLFTPEMIFKNLGGHAAMLDKFTPQWQNSVLNDQSAALLASLIENLNLTFPRNTYDEFAIPSIKLSPTEQQIQQNSSVSTMLPVWRGDLQCVALSSSNFRTEASNSRFNNGLTVNATYVLPSICPYGGSNGTDGFINFVHTFTTPISENSTFVGKLLDLHVGPYDPIRAAAQDELVPSLISDNPLNCPSLALMYGFVNLTTGQNRIIVEVCDQKLQRIPVSMRFSDTRFNIDSDPALIVDEQALQYVQWDGQSVNYTPSVDNATSFQYRLQNHFDNAFVVFNSTRGNKFSKVDISRPAIDSFFQGVFFGRSALPLDSLHLQDGSDAARVKAGILAFYRRYMAQAISLNMRVPSNLTEGSTQQTISIGIEQGSAQRRLLQNETSKITLQIMLAFMLTCGVLVRWRFKMDKLLPESANPCTIWGQMSLWAGSEYRTDVHEQVHMDEVYRATQEQAQKRVQLGWWLLSDDRQRYGFKMIQESYSGGTDIA